jgi:hypothetical protein
MKNQENLPRISTMTNAMKNEFVKRILRNTGLRPPQSLPRRNTPHYRMPKLEANGGWLTLKPYSGPKFPREEYESLTFTTYPTDARTYFAPITSATGKIELGAFGGYGKCDLDREWTSNAEKCPTIIKWLESIGARFGKVQLLRMMPNTLRECRWGLHLDYNNQNNPESNGWAVRIWLELTHDDSSRLIVRKEEFDKSSEVQIPLPRHAQVVVDSQWLYHGGYHNGTDTRYALIATFESGPELERWIESQMPSPRL